MIKHRTDLFKADTREPLYELRRQRSVFKILEERRDGHASAPKYPNATDAFRVAFNRRTG